MNQSKERNLLDNNINKKNVMYLNYNLSELLNL